MNATATARLVVEKTPPSVNVMLSGPLRERIRRKNDWAMEATAAWMNAGQPTFRTPVTMTVTIWFRDQRRRDRHNYEAGGLKPFIDQLVRCGCIVDDNDQWLSLELRLEVDSHNPRMEITIRASGPVSPI